MNRTSFLLLALMVLPALGISQSLESMFQQEFEALFEKNQDAVGAIIHVEYPEKNISWTSAVGYSEKGMGNALNANQPLLLASNTKPYVAASILRLVEMNNVQLDQALSAALSKKTIRGLKKAGYDLESITIKHLLSHSSGIQDYVDETYFDFVDQNPTYSWKKKEQIALSTKKKSPLIKAGREFSYGDINYLLLTEIIELETEKPFYTAMHDLLKFDELGIKHTWFKNLESIPDGTKAMAHQYADKYDWDSYDINPSWDLYGGGGLASTAKESALFFQYLFEGRIIEDREILEQMWSYVLPAEESKYCLGLYHFQFDCDLFYHGGWWGTDVAYSPQSNASVAMFTLEKGKRDIFAKFSKELLESLAETPASAAEVVVTEEYELHKANESKALLVLFPGGGATSIQTKEEFDILAAAAADNISVLLMNFNRHLWIEEDDAHHLSDLLNTVIEKHQLNPNEVVIGGISIGGNVALSLSNYLHEQASPIAPKGVFTVDSPIDLYALYQSSIKDTKNPNLTEDRLSEPKWIIEYFEEEFDGRDSLLKNIQSLSPFTWQTNSTSVPFLRDTDLRFYTEPDSLWWFETRLTDFEGTNAFAIEQVTKQLSKSNWDRLELIETENKGYRANGERHPHSWSIVDVESLIQWIKD